MTTPWEAVPDLGVSPVIGDADIRAEVLRGLRGTPKMLPAKLFYDRRGAKLFEHICELDEYYLTRAELEILTTRAGEIAELVGSRAALVEYGSGAGVKTECLLAALRDTVAYIPIDISGEQLDRVSGELAARHADLHILPVCEDYTKLLALPSLPAHARRVAFFPGSTIGNFHPAEASLFLRRVRRAIGRNGAMILGVDRRKDPAQLHAAYNDAVGVTAEFNRNVLVRLNRELNADFDLERFRHRALFNDEASRIEMHLESLGAQTVKVAGAAIDFADGETIWTECSYKYDFERLERVVAAAGFVIDRLWTDSHDRFWVAYLLGDDR